MAENVVSNMYGMEPEERDAEEKERSSVSVVRRFTEIIRTSPLKSGPLISSMMSSPVCGSVEFKRRSIESAYSIHDYCRASNSKTPRTPDVSPDGPGPGQGPGSASLILMPQQEAAAETEGDAVASPPNPDAEHDIIEYVPMEKVHAVNNTVSKWFAFTMCCRGN